MASGGSRPGSGRPFTSPDKKRVQISISVSPETMAIVQELRRRGVKVGLVVDDLLRQYFDGQD